MISGFFFRKLKGPLVYFFLNVDPYRNQNQNMLNKI